MLVHEEYNEEWSKFFMPTCWKITVLVKVIYYYICIWQIINQYELHDEECTLLNCDSLLLKVKCIYKFVITNLNERTDEQKVI